MGNRVTTMDVIPATPFRFTHQGARPDMLRPPLWCGGLAGAFRFFLQALGAKWGWMLGWSYIQLLCRWSTAMAVEIY
ncbi:MAG: hypothetical protein K0A89_07590 [ANME-2 cluster archaeon]|nr:hypothetical protein [ANME-2 cluster archaeon]